MRLTGENEPAERYHLFRGRYVDKMPQLVRQGYKPLSIADSIYRRLRAPEEVIKTWRQNYIDTIDGIAYGKAGDALITLDTKLLHDITPRDHIARGSLLLGDERWELLKFDKSTLYLTPDEIAEASEKGYCLQEGTWNPENKSVEKIWNHLSRGLNLTEYAMLVGETARRERVMRLFFDRTKKVTPILKPWLLFGFSNLSRTSNSSMRYHQAQLIGEKIK